MHGNFLGWCLAHCMCSVNGSREVHGRSRAETVTATLYMGKWKSTDLPWTGETKSLSIVLPAPSGGLATSQG